MGHVVPPEYPIDTGGPCPDCVNFITSVSMSVDGGSSQSLEHQLGGHWIHNDDQASWQLWFCMDEFIGMSYYHFDPYDYALEYIPTANCDLSGTGTRLSFTATRG